MKLVRFGEPGYERAGVIDDAGTLREMSPIVNDWTVDHLSDEWLAALRAVEFARMPAVEGNPRVGPPIARIRQLIAIGLNYREHADEAGLGMPGFPMLFQKALGSVSGPTDDVLLHPEARALDWEAELAFIIRKRGRHIAHDDAREYIGGFCLAMDISERDWQFSFGGQVGKGKSYDSFTPIGPWLLTADEMFDPQDQRIWLSVNGVKKQDASTAEMIFTVAQIIEHVSRFQTLLPGDVILTGTPAGVGFGAKPPVYLKAGDCVECGITLLGEQRHLVAAESNSPLSESSLPLASGGDV